MKIDPQDVELTFRDMTSYVLRAYLAQSLAAIRRLNLDPVKNAKIVEISFALNTLLKAVEGEFNKDEIPTPARVKAIMHPALSIVSEELGKIIERVYAQE